MKLVKKQIVENGEGWAKLIPEEPEDIWHIYNLLSADDKITTKTFRKVQKETETGSSTSTKKKIVVCISVEDIDFDSAASEIRIKGKNQTENLFIKLGQYHTIQIGLHRQFTLSKPLWDKFYIERLHTACDPSNKAEISAILLEEGCALLYLITSHMTLSVAKIEHTIPRKRMMSSSNHDRAMEKFYGLVVEGVQKHFNLDILKCVIVASAGFLKDELLEHLKRSAVLDKSLAVHLDKFLGIASSSGHQQALKSIMEDPALLAQIQDTKAAKDVQALQEFFETLGHSADRAFYGLEHIKKAIEAKAVKSLLITDALFRSAHVGTRKMYISLVEQAREDGALVSTFSSLHPSGQQLDKMTGIAAVLRFPMPELDYGSSEDEE